MAAESFWKYAVDPRQQPAAAGTAAPAPAPVWQRSGNHHASGPVAPPPVPAGAAPLKRQRPDYFDRPSRQERAGFHEAMGSSYGRHLNNEMTYVGASQITRPRGGMAASPNDNYHMMGMVGLDSRNMGSPRTYPALRPDASNTLYVEGLPGNCTRREVSYIFRPFSGFREVRLVNKESRHPGWYHVLCFVDFATPAQALVALETLQASSLVIEGNASDNPGSHGACNEALSLAMDINANKLVIASDCLEVIKNLEEMNLCCYGVVLNEIKVRKGMFKHEKRVCNGEAHELAKAAAALEGGRYVWLLYPPGISAVPLKVRVRLNKL